MASLGDGEVAVAGWFDGTLTVAQRRLVDPSSPAPAAWTCSSRGWRATAASAGSSARADRATTSRAASRRWRGRERARPSIAITGAIGDGAVFGPGEPHETRAPAAAGPVFAARLDGDGALAWARFAGGGVPGQGYGVALGADRRRGHRLRQRRGVVRQRRQRRARDRSIPPIGRAFVARWDAGGRLLVGAAARRAGGEGDAIAIGAGGAIVGDRAVPGHGALRRRTRRRRR